MATTPSPKSPENDKSKRYDRQLRYNFIYDHLII